MVAWQPVGVAMGVYDMAVRYLGEREQFGTPLAAFQITQEKLARMLGHIQVCCCGWKSVSIFSESHSKATLGQLAC